MIEGYLPSSQCKGGILLQNAFYSYTESLLINYYDTPGWEMKEFHFHDHWEIKICRKCDMRVVSDGDSAECHGPCVVIYRPFALHWANSTTDGAFERYNINFFENYIERYLENDVRPQTLFCPGVITLALDEKSVEKIYGYCRNLEEEKGDEEKKKLLLVLILREIKSSARLVEGSHSLSAHSPENIAGAYSGSSHLDYIYSVMKYLNDNIGEHGLVEKTAKAYFVSSAKLRSDFKLLTRATLGDYIDCVRLINAKRLLAQDMSVSQTADRCGYSNRNSFIRFFKVQTGMTPSKYSSSADKMPKS